MAASDRCHWENFGTQNGIEDDGYDHHPSTVRPALKSPRRSMPNSRETVPVGLMGCWAQTSWKGIMPSSTILVSLSI